MTKEDIRKRLAAGETLDSILRFRWGQECLIFKADEFVAGDDVLYVPDIDLNEIPVDKDLSSDVEGIFGVLGMCYTGNDIIADCNGDEELALEVFEWIDWEHPSSALPDVWLAREEEREYMEMRERRLGNG